MSEGNYGSGVPEIKIIFTGTLAQVGRALRPAVEIEGKRIGQNFVTLGT